MSEPTTPPHGSAGHTRYQARHRRRSRSRRSRRILVAVNIVVAVCLLGAAGTVGYAEWRLHQIRKVRVHQLTPVGRSNQSQTVAPTPAGPPMTFLIVGSDSRAALQGPDNAQFGGSAATPGARSDTIILARVVPATRQVEMLSIPRDLFVPIPGLGTQRINAALGHSPDLLVQVIKQQLGIDVNHYIDVDFNTFRDISNAVGGVQVYFPTKAKDRFSGLQIAAPGCYPLQGDQALAFVRSREYQYYENGSYQFEPASDLARIQRQQIFIRGMVKKAESVGLTNPVALNGIIGGVTRHLTVDSSLSASAMVNLARTFRSINAASIPGLTLPTTPQTLGSGAEVLMPDPGQDKAVVAQFLAFGQKPAGAPPPASAGGTTTSSSTSTTTTTLVAPSSVSVQVLNGSGVAGQAGQMAAGLRRAGFHVAAVGSMSSYGTATTTIQYGPGGQAGAQTLAASIGGGTVLQEVPSLGSSTAVVVTGKSFNGVTGAGATSGGSAPSTSASSTTSSTTVPATTTTTRYELPGTPAGSTPPVCGN
ncbi:MAG: LCP family protein [Acidimicrobiales bacterium]